MSRPKKTRLTRPRAVSDLGHGNISNTTLATYKIHMKRFLTWSEAKLEKVRRLPAEDLDGLLKRYLEHLYRHKASYAGASQTMSAVRYFRPNFTAVAAAAALRSFRKKVPKTSRLPMPWTFAVVVAIRMEKVTPGMGVAVLVAYAGLLRANEVLALTRGKVFTSDVAKSLNLTDNRMKLGLDHTKTGVNQLATLQFPQVESVLMNWCNRGKFRLDEKVFSFTYLELATAFRKACDEEWPEFKFTLHSLRHGCAVHLLQCNFSRDYVKFAGRWLSDSTVEIYSQANAFLTMANAVSKSRRDKAKKLTDALPAPFIRSTS